MRLFVMAALIVFVAQDQDKIDKFASELVVEGDETVGLFRDALKTPEGKLVLRDRAEKAVVDLKRQAEKEALSEFFKTKVSREEFRKDLIEGHKTYQADMKLVGPALKEIREKLAPEPQVNRLLANFLGHDLGPALIYQIGIAPKTRPSVADFLKELGGYLVRGDDGLYQIPEARIEELKPICEIIKRKIAALDKIAKSIQEFSEKISSGDDFHKRLREAAKDRLFTSILLIKALRKDEADEIEQAAETFAEQIETAFARSDKGYELLDKGRKEVEEALDKFDAAKRALQVLRPPARKLSDSIRKGNDLDEAFARFLREDYIILGVADEMDVTAADPVKALHALIFKAVEKKEDGTYSVLEGSADEISRSLSKMLRDAEKKMKEVAKHAEQVENKELRDILLTPYGTFAIEQTILADLAARSYDGLGAWIARHFEKGRLRPDSKREIEAILRDVERLRKEAEGNGKRD